MIACVIHRRAAFAAAIIGLVALSGCGLSVAPDCGALRVDQSWVRMAPAGADVMGGYFTLVNEGDSQVYVDGITSSQFDDVQMHETRVDDGGQARMAELEQVAVPPGERVAFEPGGRHAMLFAPERDFAVGERVELVLRCGAEGDTVSVSAPVRTRAPAGEAAGMDHGSHDHAG